MTHPLDEDVFALPIRDRWLLYAPHHRLTALVDAPAVHALRQGTAAPGSALADLRGRLTPDPPRPTPPHGPVTAPRFLALIPTRGCALRCRYCDFAAGDAGAERMSPTLAAAAIDGYLALLRRAGRRSGELHFFGGEPFAAPALVQFAVEYAAQRAAAAGIGLRFEVITNGVFSDRLGDWIGRRFDTVVVSLDGPAAIHDRYRPTATGRGTHARVVANARRLAQSDATLIIRTCVTAESVGQLPDIARQLAALDPEAVCFECLTDSPASVASGLRPPDPWAFAAAFLAAAAVLDERGIRAVHSTAVLDAHQVSFCPVGDDALIVSPDGRLASCYLPPEEWQAQGLDMYLGRVAPAGELLIDQTAADRLRRDNHVDARPGCAGCFCRFHCCGGCHVHHRAAHPGPPDPDPACVRTRLITAGLLLRRLGQPEATRAWLSDPAALWATAARSGDRLAEARP